MNSAFKSFAVAGGVMLAGVLAGCGWFSGDDDDARDGARPVSSPLDNVTRMHLIPPTPPSSFDPPFDNILGAAVAYGLYPSGVAPDCGPFAGGTPVTISGDFSIIPGPLTAAQAAAAYWVYFGGVLGSFDATFDPNTVTSTEFHVITPSAPATGRARSK